MVARVLNTMKTGRGLQGSNEYYSLPLDNKIIGCTLHTLKLCDQGITGKYPYSRIYEAKKEWTIVLQCYSKFHGWRADYQTQ